MKKKDSWRFYIFSTEKHDYLFDCFSHKIYTINNDLSVFIRDNDYRAIKKYYKKFYKSVLKISSFHIKEQYNEKCNVTINLSNNCNLNCNYCYRCKTKKSSLTENNLTEIMDYITKIYDPDATEYAFSLCYTSESSFDLDKLKYFDYLSGQYERYLFDSRQITELKAEQLFYKLPHTIQTKWFSNDKDFIKMLNNILINEELWKIYDYKQIEYLSKVLNDNINLSYSRKIMANRQILNKFFEEFNIETKIKYISMSFMTNGTNVTDEYIAFMKSILMDTIYVSIDGPQFIHDANRKYFDSRGSFNDVISGIEKLKQNGLKVIASVVITPEYPELDKIVDYLISIGFETISFNLVRGKTPKTQFSKESIDILLNSIRKLFDSFLNDFIEGKVSKELFAIKNTILFSALKKIYYRNYVTSRCTWGKELVIDSDGNLYHCNSTIGYKEDLLGHYKDSKTRGRLLKIPNVQNFDRCKNCYAKYLCGGTCYAEMIYGNKQNEDTECYFKKELINENMNLYAKLYEASLLDDFIKVII